MLESTTNLQVHLTQSHNPKNFILNRTPPTATAESQVDSSPTGITAKMESKSEFPPPASSPQYVSHSAQFGQNFPHFGQSINFLSPQSNQFSPIQFNEPRLPARSIKDRGAEQQPAEILDLDSNRVHLYNIQQEQSFYRPYLMAQAAQPIPLTGNGWSQPPPDARYASHPFSQEIYPRNAAPPPPPASTSAYNNYVIEAAYVSPPVTEHESTQPFQAITQQPQPRSVGLGRNQEREASPTAPVQITAKKKENGPGESTIPPEMMRGKGKGGACKRPKAYECTSCSKWFTSSGHLKRHYGTTLHKNSAQQNGTEGMEPAVGPGRGKGKKTKKIKMDLAETSSNPGHTSSPRPMSNTSSGDHDRPKNGHNGISTEIQTAQFAPQVIHHQAPHAAYLYIGDPQLLASQHQPQFVPHFEPSATIYNPHSLSLPGIYNTTVGYPVMEVSLPPFNTHTSVSASQYTSTIQFTGNSTADAASYQRNGNTASITNGASSVNGSSSEPNDDVKQEHPDESPEVVRGASPGMTALPWLSPADQTSLEDSSLSSPSSEHELAETLAELSAASLDNACKEGKEERKQLIQCPNCTKTFTRACYLTQHKNSLHSPEGRRFKCPLCGKKFLEEPALSEHVSKHGGNKPFKCSLCPKDFNHKTDLRRHLCQHTGAMPFSCDCGKGFTRKDHMLKHAETHRKNSSKSLGPMDLTSISLNPTTMPFVNEADGRDF